MTLLHISGPSDHKTTRKARCRAAGHPHAHGHGLVAGLAAAAHDPPRCDPPRCDPPNGKSLFFAHFCVGRKRNSCSPQTARALPSRIVASVPPSLPQQSTCRAFAGVGLPVAGIGRRSRVLSLTNACVQLVECDGSVPVRRVRMPAKVHDRGDPGLGRGALRLPLRSDCAVCRRVAWIDFV